MELKKFEKYVVIGAFFAALAFIFSSCSNDYTIIIDQNTHVILAKYILGVNEHISTNNEESFRYFDDANNLSGKFEELDRKRTISSLIGNFFAYLSIIMYSLSLREVFINRDKPK